MGVEERVRDKFLTALEGFESGHLPHENANDFAKVNAQMSILYRKAVAAAEAQKTTDQEFQAENIQPEGIQKAQSAWLKYRDEWVAFAKLHYPSTDSNAWLTLLTKNRAASLRMTFAGLIPRIQNAPRSKTSQLPVHSPKLSLGASMTIIRQEDFVCQRCRGVAVHQLLPPGGLHYQPGHGLRARGVAGGSRCDCADSHQ